MKSETVEISRETLMKVEGALRAVIEQYTDQDYAEGDSWSVRLACDALAAIEGEPIWTAPVVRTPAFQGWSDRHLNAMFEVSQTTAFLEGRTQQNPRFEMF
ncbi:MAG: hypothetical protein KJ000_29585 [Pirellulaceae bacterium]|nr:hypothetical protein [Pirellulaceae bacterium]